MELEDLSQHVMNTGKQGIKELFTEAKTLTKEET